jgi:hypothetical protein
MAAGDPHAFKFMLNQGMLASFIRGLLARILHILAAQHAGNGAAPNRDGRLRLASPSNGGIQAGGGRASAARPGPVAVDEVA